MVDFLLTDEAQKVFGEEGYRPVSKAVLDTFDFPTPPSLFTIDDVGGWERGAVGVLRPRERRHMAEVQKEVGQPTRKAIKDCASSAPAAVAAGRRRTVARSR